MKKLTIIISNIVLLAIVILSLEYYVYIKQHKFDLPFIHLTSLYAPTNDEVYQEILDRGYYGLGNHQGLNQFRRPVFQKTNLKPIVIFGCSFAWGARLHEHQTFHYKLSNLMKRTVYNRAISCWGVQHMLYQVKREDFYKEVPEPEYVIFVYIGNHISRLYKYHYICDSFDYNYLKYDREFKGLKEEKRLQNIPYSRIYNDVILRKIAEIQESKFPNIAFAFLEKHFLESKKEIEKHWKSVKFIILDYESEEPFFTPQNNVLNEKNVKKLEKDGFIVIKTSQLTDKKLDEKYFLDKKDGHPNEKAWNLITPLLAEKMKNL